MKRLGRIESGVRTLLRRARREADLDEEIRFHIEAATSQYEAQGLTPDEARRRALLDFGGIDRAKEGVRENWALARVAEISRDLRVALRGIRRRPAHAATIVVTLALAVGGAGAVFNALWAVVARPLPLEDDSRLALLRYTQRRASEFVGLSPLEVADYRSAARTVSGLAEYHSMHFTLLGHGEPRRVQTGVVSPNYFSLLGVRPALGRDFVAADDRAEATPVLLLSDRFWRRAFGADPEIVGADFTMNDRIHTVIGVLPPLPPSPDDNDVYMPVASCPFRSGEHWPRMRDMRGLRAVVRLRPESDLKAATADFELISDRLNASHPEAYPEELDLTPHLTPLRESMIKDAKPTLWLLSAAAVFVLLLVFANLVNLTLAQLERRGVELAMRSALGGSWARLARQLATESCALALTGGALGLVLAATCGGVLAEFVGRLTPRATEIRVDGAAALLVLTLSLLMGLAIGVAPMLAFRRNPLRLLRAGAPTTTGQSSTRLRDLFVIVQVAASVVLLVGAGLMMRSFWNLQGVPAGFEHSDVLTMGLPVNWTKYPDDEARNEFAQHLLERVQSVPGVVGAALADSYPLNSELPWERRVEVGPVAPERHSNGPTADFRIASPAYFETVGVRLVEGRLFTDADRDAEHAVGVINRAFARALFPDRNPIGQQVTFGGGNTSWTIIGIVADVRQHGLGQPPTPELFAPLALSTPGNLRLLVRGHQTRALLQPVSAAVREVDPDQPITDVRTLAEARGESLAQPRSTAALLAIASMLALVIAAAGLAGLLAYTLGQRQREFGLRLALGATRADIARMVLGRSGKLVATGILLGVLSSLALTRGLQTMLYGLAITDPLTYLAVTSVLLGASLLACMPALRRALATAPSLALRTT